MVNNKQRLGALLTAVTAATLVNGVQAAGAVPTDVQSAIDNLSVTFTAVFAIMITITVALVARKWLRKA